MSAWWAGKAACPLFYTVNGTAVKRGRRTSSQSVTFTFTGTVTVTDMFRQSMHVLVYAGVDIIATSHCKIHQTSL